MNSPPGPVGSISYMKLFRGLVEGSIVLLNKQPPNFILSGLRLLGFSSWGRLSGLLADGVGVLGGRDGLVVHGSIGVNLSLLEVGTVQ